MFFSACINIKEKTMNKYDVFNGDADGICALLQLRLAKPAVATLVTGIKRDIKLLATLDDFNEGDQVTVLDISMDKNKNALNKLLAQGVSVLYIDHHLSGNIPQHKDLHAIIDTTPTTCTSLLTNNYIQGQFAKWAVVGAYGDNMLMSAKTLSISLSLKEKECQQLRQLGMAINYNAYGASIDDLHYHPATLYKQLIHYTNPLHCIADKASIYEGLYAAYTDELSKASALKPECRTPLIAVYKLPNEAWARRVSGVFGNQLANQYPNRAHSIISDNPAGGYVVSVRAPITNLRYAGHLCQQFATGGGREGAAGINQLPIDQLQKFIDQFTKTYS